MSKKSQGWFYHRGREHTESVCWRQEFVIWDIVIQRTFDIIWHYEVFLTVQHCPFGVHSCLNPSVVKTWKLTVSSNSRPNDFARFALGGTIRGAEGGHRQKCKNGIPFVHKTLPVGNPVIWTHPTIATSHAKFDTKCVYTPTQNQMWFSDTRHPQ